MSTASPEHPERPKNIYDTLIAPTDQYVVFDLIQMQKARAEYRHEYSDSTLELAQVCMNVAAGTINAIENEHDGELNIHPGYIGDFTSLEQNDQNIILTSYGALIMGTSILTLRIALDANTLFFDKKYFCNRYNETLATTRTPRISPEKDLSAGQKIKDNPDFEPINTTNWNILTASYDKVHTIDFAERKVWEALPVSLRSFLKEKHVSQTITNFLSPAFVRQIAYIRKQEIPQIFRDDPFFNDLDLNF